MFSRNNLNSQLEEMAHANLDRMQISEKDIELITDFKSGYELSNKYYGRFIEEVPEFEPSTKAIEISQLLLESGIGLLLIRPEFFSWLPQVLQFLTRNGFEIVYTNTVKIDSAQYQKINRHVIENPDAQYVMPTRTLVYTAGNSCVVLFKDKLSRYKKQKLKLPDYFCKYFKGRHAKPQENTVRGELVYSTVKDAGYHNPNELTSLAIDPTKDFRNIVRQNIQPNHLTLEKEDQLLEYTGVCIHVPNADEFVKDCSCLVSETDLETLITTLFFTEQ